MEARVTSSLTSGLVLACPYPLLYVPFQAFRTIYEHACMCCLQFVNAGRGYFGLLSIDEGVPGYT